MTDLKSPLAAKHVAIIGAGPAGLMAAGALAEAGARVTVFDRMPSPARKFLMAGRGGLNLTHSEPLDLLQTRYSGSTAAMVQAAVRGAFTPDQVRAWADGLGADTFVGSSGRVFPRVMKATPLLRAWLQRLDAMGVELAARHTWQGFGASDSTLRFTGPGGALREVSADACLLALGGASWPRLGSDGGWVSILSSVNVNVAPLTASNCGVYVPWSDVFRARFEGTPLKRIAVSAAGKSVRGAAVITRSGLEGGAIYAMAPQIRSALRSAATASLTLDLRPDVDAGELARRISRPRGDSTITNHLRKAAGLEAVEVGLLREGAGSVVLPSDGDGLAQLIKAVPVRVTALAGLERAISTAGGIAAEALDGHFMLRARPGVFAAGEMLDWDAPTGGYLLQGCLATGRAAAAGVLRWLSPPR